MHRKAIHFFHEIGMLSETPRSGFAFLGSGKQSVAEHSYRTALIAYALAELVEEPVDKEKVLMYSLLHDLPEARTGDLNYVNKRYVQTHEDKALEDMEKDSGLAKKMASFIREYKTGESLESKLVHDADQLELLLFLKKEQDLGNPRAMVWYEGVQQRLTTPIAKELAEQIKLIPHDEWWLLEQHENS